VGEISQALNAGRHTTTTTTWYWLDDARRAGALIDSPGFQEFGLRHRRRPPTWPADARPAASCRALPLLQLQPPHEPGCGVRAAWTRGEISPSRYRIYGELFDAELSQTRWSSAPGAGDGLQPSTLASVSSATSSIHSTTERHTRPTTLCRWPSAAARPGWSPRPRHRRAGRR
jgi:hypothetical protein